VRTVKEFTPQQLFWITKYGFKMTAMPAFGPTHKDDIILAIIAFLQKLQDMTKEQYQLFLNGTKDEGIK
jgi:hypothetical protein